ncbi:uncharacterized protein EV420DRAFT_1555996 [Desarmillaria tabescens]|uniref:F-box domain-containing protein n=1 Tax=Armillaria tabescens TaxID=1929756 RepID=A0AA39K465_ARMTA|nr:uncharacterized protein EV420DRAFT_1555996 [Desarmillaria tabescens]KAK0454267.1 hypothetical protein EV420DRAFT_1555996 [Desarmillaria tabescens]
MPPSSSPNGYSPLEQFPVELVFEILSYLNVPTIKRLSLVSSTLRPICFPAIFQSISISAYRTPRDFLTDMRLRWPIPCVRKLSFNSVDADLKPYALLQWCAPARELEMRSISNPRLYVPLLSGLGELRVVRLDRIAFHRFADLFELLQSLSSKVKDLTIGSAVGFASMPSENDPILWTRKRIKLEKLSISTSLVLELLLREDSPVDLSQLNTAETRNVGSHTINKLGRLSPRLVKLVIKDPPLESNNEYLELPAIKELTLSFRVLERRSTPLSTFLKPSDANLEELTIKLPLEFVMEEGRGEWEWLALVLSRRSKLKRVKVMAWTRPCRIYKYAVLMLNELRHKLEPWRRRILAILASDHFEVTMDVAHLS